MTRDVWVRRGRSLEWVTIAYNGAEAALSIGAGVAAGSVSLLSFGLDSVIETISGSAVLWRLHDNRERAETVARRISGWSLVALALYIAVESVHGLVTRERPDRSFLGIAIAATSVVVMPLLARAKRRVAAALDSGAVHADSRQTDFSAYLSAILLAGLILNATAGWWWADPAAALVMTPIVAKGGIDALRNRRTCGTCGGCGYS
jgi:divalent metal cation (Fe/Co/Zn/Cd) transporter